MWSWFLKHSGIISIVSFVSTIISGAVLTLPLTAAGTLATVGAITVSAISTLVSGTAFILTTTEEDPQTVDVPAPSLENTTLANQLHERREEELNLAHLAQLDQRDSSDAFARYMNPARLGNQEALIPLERLADSTSSQNQL